MKKCSKCQSSYPATADHFYRQGKKLRPRCKKCEYDDYVSARVKNPQSFKEAAFRSRQKLRKTVLNHYGNNNPHCVCCYENKIEFLSLDHIKGGGNKQRKAIKRGSREHWKWFVDNIFPTGFRILCHNCNLSYGFYGYCPHQQPVEWDINAATTG